MSQDEIELRELITDKLTNTGFLYDIKAQIRAAVLHVLSQDSDPKFSFHERFEKVRDSINNTEGKIAISLIKDFLEKLGLKNTLSVLELETGLMNLEISDRVDLLEKCGGDQDEFKQNDPAIYAYIKKCTNEGDREIIRGSAKNISNVGSISPKSKRILPQVKSKGDKEDFSLKSEDASTEFSDVIGLPDSPKAEKISKDQLCNSSASQQRSNSGLANNEYSYEESFNSDKSSDTKQNDKSEQDDSIKEIDCEEIDEKSESKTGDITIDSERSLSLDYVESV